MPKIAIIENSDGLGKYFTQFPGEIEYRIFPVWNTLLFPDEKYDAYVLTGDYNNVSDGLLPFHRKELEFLKTIAGKKIFGSCFSHQLLGEVFGGKVEKREKRFFGWHPVFIREEHPVFRNLDNPHFLSLNGDEVVEKPAPATVLATNPECRFQFFLYGDNVLTCQAHPEILKQDALDIIEKHRERLAIRCPDLDEKLKQTESYADDEVNRIFLRNLAEWLLS